MIICCPTECRKFKPTLQVALQTLLRQRSRFRIQHLHIIENNSEERQDHCVIHSVYTVKSQGREAKKIKYILQIKMAVKFLHLFHRLFSILSFLGFFPLSLLLYCSWRSNNRIYNNCFYWVLTGGNSSECTSPRFLQQVGIRSRGTRRGIVKYCIK